MLSVCLAYAIKFTLLPCLRAHEPRLAAFNCIVTVKLGKQPANSQRQRMLNTTNEVGLFMGLSFQLTSFLNQIRLLLRLGFALRFG